MEKNIPDWHRRGDYIPHRENKSFQTITFRLFDTFPVSVLAAMRRELKYLEGVPDDNIKMARVVELYNTLSRYEDVGYGCCFLKDARIAKVVAEALHHFDGERYRLIAYCIMPNHVHLMVELAPGWTLSELLHSWRSFTAKKANQILGRSGPFWMEEYYDRYIRNDEHFANALQYIRMNPVRAGLASKVGEWPWTWEMADMGIFWKHGYWGRSFE